MSADDYEKKYMGGEEALARSRASMPWWFHLMLGSAVAVIVASALMSGHWAGLIGLPLLCLVWLLFLFLRATVTPDTLHIQLGLFGPKIPIADIAEVSVAKYDPLKYGGWGIRLGTDGSVAYSVPGHGGRGLRVRFTRGGRERTVFVTSPNPDELLAAIERARGLRIATETRVAEASDGVEEEEDGRQGAKAPRAPS